MPRQGRKRPAGPAPGAARPVHAPCQRPAHLEHARGQGPLTTSATSSLASPRLERPAGHQPPVEDRAEQRDGGELGIHVVGDLAVADPARRSDRPSPGGARPRSGGETRARAGRAPHPRSARGCSGRRSSRRRPRRRATAAARSRPRGELAEVGDHPLVERLERVGDQRQLVRPVAVDRRLADAAPGRRSTRR